MPKGSRRTPKGRRHPKGAPDEIGEALEYAAAMEEAQTTGAGVGCPTKYRKSMLALVKQLANIGLTEREIALGIGISLKTVTNWKAEHPEFLRALRINKAAANHRVETALYHRAAGYTYDVAKTVQKEGEEPIVITQEVHYPPEVGAIKLWLTNRDEKRWKDLKSTELSTPPGRPLEFAPALPTEHEAAAAYAQRILAAASGRRTDSRSVARVGTDRRSGPGSSGSEDAGEG